MSARVEVYQRNGYGWGVIMHVDDVYGEWAGWWSERTARRHAGRMLRRWRRDHREES